MITFGPLQLKCIGRRIVTGAFYAASWDLMEAVKTATLIYAPLSFGDYVRITGTFLKLFEPALTRTQLTRKS